MKAFCLVVLFGFGSYLAQAQPNQFLREMQTRLENSNTYTIGVAQAMPEDKYDFRPVAGEMTFQEQLLHMAQNLIWLTSSYLTATPPPFNSAALKAAGQSRQETTRIVAEAYAYTLAAIRLYDPEQLEKSVDFFAGPLSQRQIMMLLNDHQTHHRGQLVVYLRLNGIKPPAYVGW